MEVTGRYYGLVQFVGPLEGTDQFRVRHFNRQTRAFDGPEEQVKVPPSKAGRSLWQLSIYRRRH
jgi:predicted Abi (CAAX) family protease